ncbi:helix-turn-helix domain-containing protein [Cohnella sp.]|uniref:helix-turn-helix domain-containing protein n=1 Tax=Cohnella sp. TaxID=1883426 RepID=UPI0035652DAC
MLRVLLVDDEYMVLDRLCMEVRWESLGMEVVATASNGKQALERCAVYQPDLVLTDITMPVMDGMGLMEELKKDFPHVRFAILTAHKDFHYAQSAISLGALHYLLKTPMNMEEIEQTLLACKTAILSEKEIKQSAVIGQRLQSRHVWDIRRHMAEEIRRGLFSYKQDARQLIRGCDLPEPRFPYRVIYVSLQNRISFFDSYPEDDHSLLRFAVCQAIYESIEDPALGDVLPLGNGEAAILLQKPSSFGNGDASIQMDRLYRQMNQWFAKYMGSPLLCGVSSDSLSYFQLKGSISQALQAAEINFYDKRSDIHFYHEYQRFVWNHGSELDWKSISGKLRSLWSTPDLEQRLQGIEHLRGFVLSQRPVPSRLKKNMIALLEDMSIPLTRREWLQIEHDDFFETWFEHLESIIGKLRHQDEGLAPDLHPEIQKAISFMRDHLRDNLTLQKVADHIHMNASYLSHLFKQQTGCNFLDYLNDQRIEKAKEYLLRADLKNYELAEKVGFSNYPHFCTLFKKATGMTPNEFRRRK